MGKNNYFFILFINEILLNKLKMYLEQDDELVKTEILPFSNLLKIYKSKFNELSDNKEKEKIIKKCFIDEELCINFISNIKNEKEVLEKTFEYTKFCMSESNLLKFTEQFKDNINLSYSLKIFAYYSKTFFKDYFNELKKELTNFRLIKNGENHLKHIFSYINYFRENLCLEYDSFFPPYLSNLNYQYRFLFSGFIIIINSFFKWTKTLFTISKPKEIYNIDSPKSKYN